MSKFVDLTGQRFGQLTVIEAAPTQKRTAWFCKCDCGTVTTVTSCNLQNGHTKSCGCRRVDAMRKTATTHGKKSTPLYNVWSLMKRRCLNPHDKAYKEYGGRGITVCDEWADSFEAFHEWATNNGYHAGLSIDRIANDKGYTPDNCRWVTMKEQCNNRRSNHYCEYKGKQYTLAELSKMSGVGYDKLKQRINKLKWSVEKAVETP